MKYIIFTLLAFLGITNSVVATAAPPTIGEETPVNLPCPPGKWRLKVTMTDGTVRYDKCSAPTPSGYYDRHVYGGVGGQLTTILTDRGPGLSPELVGDLVVPIGTSRWEWILSVSFGGASGVMTGSISTGPGLLLGDSLRLALLVQGTGSGDGDSQDYFGLGAGLALDYVFAKGTDVDWGFFAGFFGGIGVANDTLDGHARDGVEYFRAGIGVKALFGRAD